MVTTPTAVAIAAELASRPGHGDDERIRHHAHSGVILYSPEGRLSLARLRTESARFPGNDN